MRNLKNTAAGAAGMLILLGALTATPAAARDRNFEARAARTATESAVAPDLGACSNLQVEEGNVVAFHAYAEGVQIYRWNGTAWAFVAPEAVLYADAGLHAVVGIHYAGPTWESVSGSKVVARAVERCPQDASTIPWLKLEATSTQGPGVFDGVTFVQRVNTAGGAAPTTPGSFAGEESRVHDTAEYYFYRGTN